MNKNESKYYNTSLLMNQALVELLYKKDYEYITIKEICKRAGVNRSTFYLHYDNVDDLLLETIENINKRFLSYFQEDDNTIQNKLNDEDKNNLIFIKPEYLFPYLNYIKENLVIFQVSAKHPYIMQSQKKYNMLKANVLFPIFSKFNISEKERKYFSEYYINGVYAIIEEWIKEGCKEEVEFISNIIIKCVRPIINKDEDKR